MHPRHPYAGELVFTAFSGSHQDAIKKGSPSAQGAPATALGGAVPADRSAPTSAARYDAVIRVNSQSGKGGVAYLLERDYGLTLPRRLQIEFSHAVQRVTDATGKELLSAEIHAVFEREYVAPDTPLRYRDHRAQHNADDGHVEHLSARLDVDGVERTLQGAGNGPVDAFVQILRREFGVDIHVQNYHEHGVGAGEDATAVSYVQLRVGADRAVYGVGLDSNIVTATLKAVVSAVNRGVGQGLIALGRATPAKSAAIAA